MKDIYPSKNLLISRFSGEQITDANTIIHTVRHYKYNNGAGKDLSFPS